MISGMPISPIGKRREDRQRAALGTSVIELNG